VPWIKYQIDSKPSYSGQTTIIYTLIYMK